MRVQVITKVELSDKRINTLSFKIKFPKVRAGVEELLSFVQNSFLISKSYFYFFQIASLTDFTYILYFSDLMHYAPS